MTSRTFVVPAALILAAGVSLTASGAASRPAAVVVPAPALDQPAPPRAKLDTAAFAGGCLWGIEAVFEHLNGVKSAISGYAGGTTTHPSYSRPFTCHGSTTRTRGSTWRTAPRMDRGTTTPTVPPTCSMVFV